MITWLRRRKLSKTPEWSQHTITRFRMVQWTGRNFGCQFRLPGKSDLPFPNGARTRLTETQDLISIKAANRYRQLVEVRHGSMETTSSEAGLLQAIYQTFDRADIRDIVTTSQHWYDYTNYVQSYLGKVRVLGLLDRSDRMVWIPTPSNWMFV